MNLHTKIEEYLLHLIQSGSLLPGAQIPTEAELSVMFSASRPTVRQALMKLTAQGYLIRTKGRGTFVAKPKVLHESTSFLSGYRQESAKKGQELITKVTALETVAGEPELLEKLSLKKGSRLIRLSRIRTVTNFNEGKPVVYTTVYVPQKKFPEMLTFDFETISFYDALEQKGAAVRHASRRLEVTMPDEEVCDALLISRFEPVILIASRGYTQEEQLIEYSESYYPAGCSQFLIEVNH